MIRELVPLLNENGLIILDPTRLYFSKHLRDSISPAMKKGLMMTASTIILFSHIG